MTFAEVITPGGYRMGEVASAMQKCIRRGLADDALFWATEADLAGFGEYVFKRLQIIASEDVGLADPHAAVLVATLRAAWRDQRKKNDSRHEPERLFLIHAVLYLAGTKKSRFVDHALIVLYEGKRDPRPVPDFALDRHTARGRSAKRAWKHFWQEGARLENRAALDDPYERQAKEIRRDQQLDFDL
jgi:replication-associated recombination protein RarA